jgi:hypothetical protein
MGSIGTMGAVSTVFAQNMTENLTETANMTTFEENATATGNDTSGAIISG